MKLLAIITSHIFFCFFFSLVFQLYSVISLKITSQILNNLFSFSFLYFKFHFRSLYWHIFIFTDFSPQLCLVYWRIYFSFVTVFFLLLAFLFDSAYIIHLSFHVVYFFQLNILIKFILNSLPDNSTMCVIPESSSGTCVVSLDFILTFLGIILLKAKHSL